MLLGTRKLAFLSLLMALAVVLIILSGVLEFNTLFLLALASFGVGIAYREGGFAIGFGFFAGSIILSVLLAPNKLYCITYGAMAFYLLVSELIYDKLFQMKSMAVKSKLLWILKYIAFNLIYVPLLIFAPKLIYAGKLDTRLFLVMLAAGQVILFLYDKGYRYFQGNMWEKVRRKLKLNE
ncbi:hypothetical protein SAMN02745217_00564 [Anaerocolumna xylanovorans DSM 12503]|uniref:DUF2232 domain-containing protein n=2 Tax=Anaerocolumna TaxID=1843210 RepID=A0A1M7XZ13_9FIRM|nr:hypothetical protein SAMN02745217_00564 [Anaerocolumna xylanovorans DSM 12503]